MSKKSCFPSFPNSNSFIIGTFLMGLALGGIVMLAWHRDKVSDYNLKSVSFTVGPVDVTLSGPAANVDKLRQDIIAIPGGPKIQIEGNSK